MELEPCWMDPWMFGLQLLLSLYSVTSAHGRRERVEIWLGHIRRSAGSRIGHL